MAWTSHVNFLLRYFIFLCCYCKWDFFFFYRIFQLVIICIHENHWFICINCIAPLTWFFEFLLFSVYFLGFSWLLSNAFTYCILFLVSNSVPVSFCSSLIVFTSDFSTMLKNRDDCEHLLDASCWNSSVVFQFKKMVLILGLRNI